MKRIISAVLSVVLIICSFNSVFAATKIYDLSGDMSAEDEAVFKPQIIDHNATMYTPWYVQYARSTKSAYEKGIRAGDGNQRIMSIDVSPINPDLVLIGSDKSGVLRSEDAGANWELVGNNNNGWGCTDILWSPTEEKTAFCMQTGNIGSNTNALNKANASARHGIYKTVDAGENWYQVLSARCLSDSCTEGLKITSSGNVYALTTDGLYKSTDNGESFEKQSDVIAEDSLIGTLEISDDEKTMIASGGGGVYMSTDGGISWETINGNLSEFVTNSTCVRVDPDDSTHLYACFDYSDNGSNLFETYDFGTTWTRIPIKNTGDKDRSIRLITFAKDENGKTVTIVAYNQWGAVYWYSEDKCKTWKQNTFDRIPEDIYSCGNGYVAEGIAVSKVDPAVVYYSFGDNIYKSTDGGKSYKWSNSGFSGINTNCVYFDQENFMWFCDVDRGLAVTDTPYVEKTYPTVSRTGLNAQSEGVAVDPDDVNHVFAIINDCLYESTDRGASWTAIEGFNPGTVLKYHKDDKNIIYTSSMTSFDGGKTWNENNKSIIAVSNVDNDVLYSYANKVLYRSADRGVTWETFYSNILASYTFYPDEFDVDTIWCGGYNGNVYKIVNGVQTAYTSANGLKSDKGLVSITAIAQDYKDKNHLIVGGKNTREGVKTPGVYETYDGGQTWVLVPGAKGTFIVNSIRFSPISEEVFIGTCSNGFYVYDYNVFKKWYNCNLTVFSTSENSEDFELTDKIKNGIIRAKTSVASETAVPVFGLFDAENPSKLIKFAIGNKSSLCNIAQVEASIDLTGINTSDTVLKFFVWNSLDMATPLKAAEILSK